MNYLRKLYNEKLFKKSHKDKKLLTKSNNKSNESLLLKGKKKRKFRIINK